MLDNELLEQAINQHKVELTHTMFNNLMKDWSFEKQSQFLEFVNKYLQPQDFTLEDWQKSFGLQMMNIFKFWFNK